MNQLFRRVSVGVTLAQPFKAGIKYDISLGVALRRAEGTAIQPSLRDGDTWFIASRP